MVLLSVDGVNVAGKDATGVARLIETIADNARFVFESHPLPTLLYRAGAEEDAKSQYILGLRYQAGEGVVKDTAAAAGWFAQAAGIGHPPAQYNLGLCYANQKDKVAAVKWFAQAAEGGYVKALYTLGICYAAGEGVKKCRVTAAQWYRQAAEVGHTAAQYKLGVCCANGKGGVPNNKVAAAHWYLRAAEAGHAKAMFRLGACYATGKGVPKDEAVAVTWYNAYCTAKTVW